MDILCQYSNIFGNPGKGVHAYRIFNIAIVDLILTFFGTYIIYYLVNKYYNKNISFWIYFLVIFIIGIMMHRLFCVRTTIDRLMFN